MPNDEDFSSAAPVRLPRWGYGPLYVSVIAICTIAATVMNLFGLFRSAKITHPWLEFIFLVGGTLTAIAGAVLWVAAVIGARIMRHIDEGQLVTTGVYEWVRHPIYSAFMLIFSGILVAQGNGWLLVLPPMFWLFLTVLMKNTEERWLHHTFGTAYADYARRVNRCIPTPPRRPAHK